MIHINGVKEKNRGAFKKVMMIILAITAVFALLLVIMGIYNKRKEAKRQIEYRETFRNYADEFDAENYRKEKERLL